MKTLASSLAVLILFVWTIETVRTAVLRWQQRREPRPQCVVCFVDISPTADAVGPFRCPKCELAAVEARTIYAAIERRKA